MQNTSTAEIAKAAGTASGTLFLYFPTKIQLINELVLMITKQESDHINSLLDPSLSVRDTFFHHLGWLHSLVIGHTLDAFQYSQQVRDSSFISAETTLESGKYFSFYYETIQKGLAEGSIKPYPIDLIGGFLYQDIIAVMNHIRLLSDPGSVDEAIQQGFELFWDGIRITKG